MVQLKIFLKRSEINNKLTIGIVIIKNSLNINFVFQNKNINKEKLTNKIEMFFLQIIKLKIDLMNIQLLK